jgi:hypothetical protein
MRSSYKKEDVELLLKDITGMIEPQTTEERERLIQSGKHYCEMLPLEYVPTQKYMDVYNQSLVAFSKPVADAVARLSQKIIERKGKDVALVSLARAGIPIGILIKHYIAWKYKIDVPHYSISIIRGRGIDHNAMRYILDRHTPGQILFVDGWIGKGAILSELKKELADFKDVSSDLAVISDPANITDLCGTHEDILIPSSCLNSTVSGLISRTVLRDDLIGPDDFHGAVFYGELKDSDLSYSFIDAIEKEFSDVSKDDFIPEDGNGRDEVAEIASHFGIDDINLVKPGIGEATRVLLRRLPWKIIVDKRYMDSPQLSHLLKLAEEKNVPVEEYPLKHYKCCGIIKKLADA